VCWPGRSQCGCRSRWWPDPARLIYVLRESCGARCGQEGSAEPWQRGSGTAPNRSRKLTAADRLLAEGKVTATVCRELGVSEATYHRWRNQFGGLKAEDAKRLTRTSTRELHPQEAIGRCRVGKRRPQGYRKRETSKSGAPAGRRSSPAACVGGQRKVRLPRDRATPRHPMPRPSRRHRKIPTPDSGTGCVSMATILAADSAPLSTMPAARAGSSITKGPSTPVVDVQEANSYDGERYVLSVSSAAIRHTVVMADAKLAVGLCTGRPSAVTWTDLQMY
jgi:transposase-like protein